MFHSEDPDALGWLAGRIVSFAGQGLHGARVFTWTYSKSVRTVFETGTDHDGRFRLGPLPVGAHHVFWCEAKEHARLRVGEQEIPQVAVFAGATNDLGDIVLAPEIVAFGRVLDADGAPVADAPIVARTRVYQLAHTITENGPPIEARTDADGSFRIGSLAPGSLEIVIRAPGYPQLRTGASVECTTQQVDFGELRFSRATTPMSGTVRDTKGRPVAGMHITANDDDEHHATTDAEGRFTLMARSEQVFYASARNPASGGRQSRRVEDPTAVHFVIAMPRFLSGRVLDAKTKQSVQIDDVSICEVRRESDGSEALIG